MWNFHVVHLQQRNEQQQQQQQQPQQQQPQQQQHSKHRLSTSGVHDQQQVKHIKTHMQSDASQQWYILVPSVVLENFGRNINARKNYAGMLNAPNLNHFPRITVK